MKSRKENINVSSSMQNKRRLHKKINDHIKGIVRQNHSVLSEERNMNAEKIPQKIIFKTKQTHKYLYKKSLINNKFEWLNKYIQNSQLQSLSINIQANNYNKSQAIQKLTNKQNEDIIFNEKKLKLNRRSRTEAAQDIDHSVEYPFFSKDKIPYFDKHSQQENAIKILKDISINQKINSEKSFKLNRSKSTKDRKNIFEFTHDNLKDRILKQKNIGISDRGSNLIHKNVSISIDSENKENTKNCQSKTRRNLKVFIDQNTPAREFLDCTARLNSSNLMFKNTSGYIKNRKKHYVFQSKQDKRQQSELLKIKRKFQDEISVEPWNPSHNENDQNDFF